MQAALASAFPKGADAQCVASLDDREGILIVADGSLSFARYEDGALSVTALDSLRGGILTKRYHAREGDSDSFRVGYRYASERGTIAVEETAGRESALIFKVIQSWASVR